MWNQARVTAAGRGDGHRNWGCSTGWRTAAYCKQVVHHNHIQPAAGEPDIEDISMAGRRRQTEKAPHRRQVDQLERGNGLLGVVRDDSLPKHAVASCDIDDAMASTTTALTPVLNVGSRGCASGQPDVASRATRRTPSSNVGPCQALRSSSWLPGASTRDAAEANICERRRVQKNRPKGRNPGSSRREYESGPSRISSF